MRIGTKSLLYGSHQFILHPLYLAVAWRRLYRRWPRGWRLWVAIVAHDWGYWGAPEMDGPVGRLHPHGGAQLVARLATLGRKPRYRQFHYRRWYEFAACHSRTYASLLNLPASPLMRADKLATALYPNWLYVALCWLSGEWVEYRDRWVAAGTYPGRADDGVVAWSRHLQANWARFRDVNAREGRAYGDE